VVDRECTPFAGYTKLAMVGERGYIHGGGDSGNRRRGAVVSGGRRQTT